MNPPIYTHRHKQRCVVIVLSLVKYAVNRIGKNARPSVGRNNCKSAGAAIIAYMNAPGPNNNSWRRLEKKKRANTREIISFCIGCETRACTLYSKSFMRKTIRGSALYLQYRARDWQQIVGVSSSKTQRNLPVQPVVYMRKHKNRSGIIIVRTLSLYKTSMYAYIGNRKTSARLDESEKITSTAVEAKRAAGGREFISRVSLVSRADTWAGVRSYYRFSIFYVYPYIGNWNSTIDTKPPPPLLVCMNTREPRPWQDREWDEECCAHNRHVENICIYISAAAVRLCAYIAAAEAKARIVSWESLRRRRRRCRKRETRFYARCTFARRVLIEDLYSVQRGGLYACIMYTVGGRNRAFVGKR